MFLQVKILKKDWFALIKRCDVRVKALDKIFKAQLKEQLVCPCYKSPKKIMSNELSKVELFRGDSIAKITSIATHLFSRHYTLTIFVNEKSIAGKVIKTNIEEASARMLFELWHCTASKKLCINAFALADKDNPNAKSSIVSVRF